MEGTRSIKLAEVSNEKGRIDVGLLCETVTERFRVKSCQGFLLIHNPENGCYVRLNSPDAFIYGCLDKDCRLKLSTSQVKEVVERLKLQPDIEIEAERFNDDPNIINLANGVFDIRTKELLQPLPDQMFINVVGFSYIAGADIGDAPNFKKFVATSLVGDEQKQKRFLEMIGYSVSNSFAAKKTMIFHGAPHSGKSVALELVKRVFGVEHTSALQLNQLSSRFASGRLSTARLNINGDIDSDVLKDISVFKQILGCDTLPGEFKFKNIFEFKPQVHLLFGCNSLPKVKNISGVQAFIDRVAILDFPVSITQDNWDTELVDKLFVERDVIFSLAMDALHNLTERNMVFTEDAGSLAVFEEFKNQLDPISAFIHEACAEDEQAQCYCGEFVKSFRMWCHDCGYDLKLSDNQISQAVITNHHIIKRKGRINGGRSMAKFVGLGLRDEDEA